MYKQIVGKENIDWGSYWLNKGISFAVAMGWENFKAGLTAIKDQVGIIWLKLRRVFSPALQ